MTETELREELQAIGIPPERWRLVAMLPLIEVAWADLRIQDAERELILRIAGEHDLLEADGWEVLGDWLTSPPKPELLLRARKLLLVLTSRHRGLGADAPVGFLSELRAQCEEVAEAAGGLLGLAWTIDKREAAVLDAIRRTLVVTPSVYPANDDLPRPPEGWGDLGDL